MTLLRRARELALDALFPPKCVGCGAFGEFICPVCLEGAPYANGERCPRCWLAEDGRSGREPACRDCARREPAFAGLRSAMAYRDVSRKAVLSLKFEGVSALAPRMGALMAEAFAAWSPPVDAIVPVPLGWLRRRTRGYNQAELLAAEVSRRTGLPLEPGTVRRARRTAPQARQPDEASRRENIRSAFAARRPASGSILLIDDVATTGATLDACARALLEAGASRVFCLTFARED